MKPATMIALMLLPTLLSGAPQDQPVQKFTVQATLTRTQADGKVITEFNKVELEPNGKTAQVRTGGTVDMQLPSGQTSRQMIGYQLDCKLTPTTDGRYSVAITVTSRSMLEEAQAAQIPQRIAGMPVFRNVIYAGTLVLADGQSAQVSGPDVVFNDILKTDIKLSANSPAPGSLTAAPAAPGQTGPINARYVVTKTEGDRKTTMIYNVPTAAGVTTSFRIGFEVPMASGVQGPTGVGNSTTLGTGVRAFTLQQVGSQIDQLIRNMPDGRFNVQATTTMRTFSQGGPFRAYVVAGTWPLGDGEQGHVSMVERETGETQPLVITVTTVK